MENEEKGIFIDLRDVRNVREECERSLVGKLWGIKTANFSGIKNTFSLLWSQKGDLRVVELGINFYQFIFSNVEDRERVMQKGPWLFDNQILVIHQWRPELQRDDPSFKRAAM